MNQIGIAYSRETMIDCKRLALYYSGTQPFTELPFHSAIGRMTDFDLAPKYREANQCLSMQLNRYGPKAQKTW